jgi:hypothetical protein
VPKVSGNQPWVAAGTPCAIVLLGPALPQPIQTHGRPQCERIYLLGMSGVEGVAEAGASQRWGLKVFAKRARKYGRSPFAPVARSAIKLCRLCALSSLSCLSCANVPPRQLELYAI